MNPPFFVKSWSSGLENDFGRFEYGTPPEKNGDYYGLQQHVALCPNIHEKMFEHFIELLVRLSDKTSTAPVGRGRKRT